MQQTDNRTAYVSIGGQPSQDQWDVIEVALERTVEREQAVKIATDKDQAGDNLAERIEAIAPENSRIERVFPPADTKDWNDALQAQCEWERKIIKPSPSRRPVREDRGHDGPR